MQFFEIYFICFNCIVGVIIYYQVFWRKFFFLFRSICKGYKEELVKEVGKEIFRIYDIMEVRGKRKLRGKDGGKIFVVEKLRLMRFWEKVIRFSDQDIQGSFSKG